MWKAACLIDDLDGKRVPAFDLREVPSLPGVHILARTQRRPMRPVGPSMWMRQVIAAWLRSFPGLPHRQEILAVIDGVPLRQRLQGDQRRCRRQGAGLL